MKKVVQIKDIGQVTILKHRTAKHIKLRVVPQKGLVITIPYYCAYEEAYHAIERRKNWIDQNLRAVKELEHQYSLKLSNFPLSTYAHTIHILVEAIVEYEVKRRNKDIFVSIPFSIPFESEENQNKLRSLIDKVYAKEAKEYLPVRTRMFAANYNLECNRISVKNQKSRWGSCSSTNNINLNLNLMKLPEHLRDYVILHELAHTIEKNHSKSFWDLLDQFTDGQARALDKELNAYNWAIL